ncbi:MAG: Phage endopeptidase (ACLAME 35) [uncultured Blastococcus sp.]|uniref:Phage endopeptidase (ACLAME 35) n=1 Tax=uncultured Blastococcus sp. TaxID=217144 RepID=A0A6J4HYC9_9ACTN|nr:MAG: Phage endopeptidase (ACLAME 35) [uncultured Blastococcus sp.]
MFHRRPSRPATPTVPGRPGSGRPVAARTAHPARTALVALVTGVTLLGTAAPALAVPPPPPNPTDTQLGDARAEQEAAAAEVGRIAALVAGAEAELVRVGHLAEAAGTAYLQAEEALLAAQEAADRAAAELQEAAVAVAAAQSRIADFSRDSYMQGSQLSTSAALLDSAGPGELIQRAAMLDYVADNQLDVLSELEVAKVAQANADSVARAARDEMAAAEDAAEANKAEADRQLAAQQGAYEQVSVQKAGYEAQLQEAQVQLLELQGARNAHELWEAQRRAEEQAVARAAQEAAARVAQEAASVRSGGGSSGGEAAGGGSGAYVFPTSGRISSCFGMRWGALHGGVDVAAPIGTPIYAAAAGTVVRSGPATGFGQALYIRGTDGAVTVYGHINEEFVGTGDRVGAGELIAEVGNRGQSTGPHLHFEVHPNGQLHSGHVNPMPWLRARGVGVAGC